MKIEISETDWAQCLFYMAENISFFPDPEAQEIFAKFTTEEQIYLLKYFRIKVMKLNEEDTPIY